MKAEKCCHRGQVVQEGIVTIQETSLFPIFTSPAQWGTGNHEALSIYKLKFKETNNHFIFFQLQYSQLTQNDHEHDHKHDMSS